MSADRSSANAVRIAFASEAVLGALGCVWGRSDYNLPLFGYLSLVFFDISPDRRKRHQVALVLLATLSLIPDLFYLLYWPGRWFRRDWTSERDHLTEKSHWLLMVIVFGEMVIKCVTIVLLALVPRCVCKPDEFEEIEVTTFTGAPRGATVYEAL